MDDTRHEKLSSYFERSATLVTRACDRLDKSYVQPGVTLVVKSFAENPVRSTFLTTFAVLSFLPVLSFLGFSLFALGTCTFLALGAALVVSAAAIAFVGFWLLLTLTLLLFVSFFLTNAVVGTYLLLRYVKLVRTGGPRAGSLEWAREVKRRARGEDQLQDVREVKAEPESEDSEKLQDAEDQVSPSTDERNQPEEDLEQFEAEEKESEPEDDTTVVIGDGSPDRRFTFKELAMDGHDSPVFVKQEPVVLTEVMPEMRMPLASVVDAL
ncbi:hypothetical protein EIP91_010193 [Steccherinum ochraceum]|uniref:Uncharacterized protein n=1 Tax=Steccherinum ochraceum TaxID=92696 RepID=A0A4R0RJR7_9APHY|nr:hypothetical protein EIP91_000240 [Steccherinum ochraceum]TCD68671.1 hypothetical protein EIP91_010193 [Steccherinum ochraceum]